MRYNGVMKQKGEKPLYRRISEDLLIAIRENKPHKKLPSEYELTRKYNVSRGTVKQAFDELEQHGLLYRLQGKGSFVAETRVVRESRQLHNYREDIRRQGYIPRAKVLTLERIAPDKKIRTLLGTPASTVSWRIVRLFFADDDPFALATSFIRTDLVPELTTSDVEISMYAALQRRYDRRPVWAKETYNAVTARGDTAATLTVAMGAPLLYSERVGYLRDMTPIEYSESFVRGDKFTVVIDWLPPTHTNDGEYLEPGA